jgi:hypothetical protein
MNAFLTSSWCMYLHVVNKAVQSEACVLHDWGKGFRVVDTLNLTASIDDKTCLVSHHLPVLGLLLEHEVTPQDPLMSSWIWDKPPTPPLFLQGCDLRFQSSRSSLAKAARYDGGDVSSCSRLPVSWRM